MALTPIAPPDDDIAVPIGARTVVFTRAEVATWLDIAKQGVVPINQRRERLRVLARQALLRRTESDEAWSQAAPLKAALNKAWPTQQPVRLVDRMLPGPSGKRRVWTAADQFLVDEANTLLNGTPFTYGHVIVDEAQDHSAVALRVIGRRSPSGSMTLVGDVAQSTTPAGQESWRDVFANLAVRGSVRGSTRSAVDGAVSGSVAVLTIGYRVPEPILEIANRLLPLTGVDAVASRSVRGEGEAPAWHTVSPDELAMSTAAVVAQVKHRHRLTGVVALPGGHAAITDALGVDRSGRRRPRASTGTRRRPVVRARGGQGPGVRRCGRREPARHPRQRPPRRRASSTWR